MIKIDKETFFKVLKPEAFNLESGVCGYGLWENTALANLTLVHSKGFGKGYYGGSWASVWAGFDTVTQELKVHCNTYEDMTWLFFDESGINEIENEDDLECAKYTINFIKTLADNGVIELMDDDTITQTYYNNLD